jgi:micrococcal nuclease
VRTPRYHIGPYKARKQRWLPRILWRERYLIATAAILALAFFLGPQNRQPRQITVPYPGYSGAPSESATPAPRDHETGYRVVDGDTIHTYDGTKYRLLGYDTPETYQAQCAEELALGQRATQRLKNLLSLGHVHLTESGKIDRYGRTLAWLTVDGQDVGGILISEGLARPYHGGRRGSWCD